MKLRQRARMTSALSHGTNGVFLSVEAGLLFMPENLRF